MNILTSGPNHSPEGVLPNASSVLSDPSGLFPLLSTPHSEVGTSTQMHSSALDQSIRSISNQALEASFPLQTSPLVPRLTGTRKQIITGKRQRVVGTSKNDVLDASNGRGKNTLVGKGGNDTLKGKKQDRLLGGGGRDRLDTRNGRRNILKGGGGNDRLFAGQRDQVFGNGGSDFLDASKGNGKNRLHGGGGNDILIGKMGDRLVGGRGNDEFVMIKRTLPSQPLIIQDFQPGRDRLGIQNFPAIRRFNDLSLSQQGKNTEVSVQGEAIAILENIQTHQINAATINGLPSIPQITVSDISPLERNPGQQALATFVVSLSTPLSENITLNYQTTVDSTATVQNRATAELDYTSVQGTITIPAGKTAQLIDVPIVGDFEDEADESFRLIVSATNGDNDTFTIADGEAIATIRDDETASVSARRSNQYSITSIDAQSILLQFDLSGLNASGDFIPDQNSDPTIGVWPGAVRDYVSGSGKLPFGVDPEPFVPNGNIALDTVDLRAELVQDAERNAVVSDGRDTIEYIFIDPSNPNPNSNELLRLSLDFTNDFFTSFVPDFNPQQGINSLAYMVQNDLLEYAVRVQSAGNQLFVAGGSQNTQPSQFYSQTLVGQDGTTLVTQFRVVGGQQELDLEDQNASPSGGLFLKAIEDFVDERTDQSFAQGDLSASRSDTVVTYRIFNGSTAQTAVLNLQGTSFLPDAAVNNLRYIIANDLLQRAFFP